MLMIPKIDPIWNVSNPKIVQQKAYDIYGKNAQILRSKTKTKKYAIRDPNGKTVNFGSISAEDYTKHRDEKRRDSYLKHSAGIKGKWKENPYSPNNLSRSLLW